MIANMGLVVALGISLLIFSTVFCLLEILVGLLCQEYIIGFTKVFYFKFVKAVPEWKIKPYLWMLQLGPIHIIKVNTK